MGGGDWRDSSDQNIFEMCVANGGPGFWIRRTTWGATCARVVGVGAMTKPGPYFGNPSVLMDVYSLAGELRENLAQVSVPGIYKTWRRIPAPSWAGHVDLRSLDDPAISATLQSLDRKRHKAPREEQKVEGRVLLSVPFSRKEEAKKLGARWSPAERLWWIPASNKQALAQARTLGFLPDSN